MNTVSIKDYQNMMHRRLHEIKDYYFLKYDETDWLVIVETLERNRKIKEESHIYDEF